MIIIWWLNPTWIFSNYLFEIRYMPDLRADDSGGNGFFVGVGEETGRTI